MAKTLEKIFEQKLQMMPPEEYSIDPSQKGRKVKPPKKLKGVLDWERQLGQQFDCALLLCFAL